MAWLALGGMLCSLQLSTGSFPRPLSPQEEKKHLERAAQGDIESRNILIERNLRLVAHIMKKYYAAESDQEDLISIGTIGLIKAVSSYKLDKNIKLATYASRCIENEILMYFRAGKKRAQDVSLSEMIETGTDGAALELQDAVAGDEDLLEALSARENARLLRAAVNGCLTEQERQVICMRYGLFGAVPRRQREVAQALGISRSYVSRIEKRALERLRRELENKAHT
jgi:RNA polymerase sporulation-specific sigma factor